MGTPRDLEARVSALEADRAVFASRLDELHGGQQVILGILADHGRMLGAQNARFDGIDTRLTQMDDRLDRMDDRLEFIVTWIQQQP